MTGAHCQPVSFPTSHIAAIEQSQSLTTSHFRWSLQRVIAERREGVTQMPRDEAYPYGIGVPTELTPTEHEFLPKLDAMTMHYLRFFTIQRAYAI